MKDEHDTNEVEEKEESNLAASLVTILIVQHLFDNITGDCVYFD